jgi:hypothetical protein
MAILRLPLAALALLMFTAGCDNTYGIDEIDDDVVNPRPDPVEPGPGPVKPGPAPVDPEPEPDAIDTAALAEALGCATVDVTEVDATERGELGAGDCVLEADRFVEYEGGEFVDAYAFRLTEATTLRLDLRAAGMDMYLYLTDADGELLASNDDRDPGDPAADENALVEADLEPGVYVALATSFDEEEAGRYTLTLSAD